MSLLMHSFDKYIIDRPRFSRVRTPGRTVRRRRCNFQAPPISREHLITFLLILGITHGPKPLYHCYCTNGVLMTCRRRVKARLRRDHGLLTHNHAFHTGEIAFLGCDFEVAVDDSILVSAVLCHLVWLRATYVTARRVPVPEPRAPIRSLATDRAPMQAPPNAAAVGIMRLSSLYML